MKFGLRELPVHWSNMLKVASKAKAVKTCCARFTFARNAFYMRYALLFLLAFLGVQNALHAQSDGQVLLLQDSNAERPFILSEANEVLEHIGELITIEACVVSAKRNDRAKGKPIFLDMFAAFPNNTFSVAIWEENQHEFLSAAEYDKKMVRITGRAVQKPNQSRPLISLHNPRQITILGDCK